MFDRLFNKNKPSTPVAVQPKQDLVVKGMPIAIVADRLRYPVELVGQGGSVLLDDGDAVTTFTTFVLLAKHSGWLGGSEFIEVSRNNLINRKLETGMTISKSDAAEFVQIVVSQSKSDPHDDPIIGDILRLFERGNVMIRTA